MDHAKVISDLKSRIGTKDREIRALKEQLDAACSSMLMEKHRLFDGAIIVRRGKRYLFDGFEKPSSIAWIKGRLMKKDGFPSGRSQILYDDWAVEPII
jgi:hypothetical protein